MLKSYRNRKRAGWAILGTGNMARQMAQAIHLDAGSLLSAVGSREQSRAERFATEHRVAHVHGSYAEVIAAPTTDLVYIATPNNTHRELVDECLHAGKAVLCEKPLACNATDAQRLVALAAGRGCLLMEAMWMRHLPAFQLLKELLAANKIGEVRHLAADFGFTAAFDPTSRLFNAGLGGGCLLDLAVYPISLAVALCGPIKSATALAAVTRSGVEEHVHAALAFGSGQTAEFTCSYSVPTLQAAAVYGTRGMIDVAPPFWRMQNLELRQVPANGTRPESPYIGSTSVTYSRPYVGNGYVHMVRDAVKSWAQDEFESNINRHSDLVETLRIVDTLKVSISLTSDIPVERII